MTAKQRANRRSYTSQMLTKIRTVESELARRQIHDHLGRWCEITMKSGEVLKIVRTGYGPMEYPERDTQEIRIGNETVEKCDNLWEVAEWICDRAYGWKKACGLSR